MDGMAVDREEENEYAVEERTTLSKDPDATWLKKGKRSYFVTKAL